MAMRQLSSGEVSTATSVFNTTIDYSSVRIADDLGLGGRPWCSPPGWGGFPFFTLHVGTSNFEGDMAGSSLLIHELTHVWQGMRNIPLWYVINSGCNQAVSYVSSGGSGGAYAVDDQLQWYEYGAEQQATIVGGWYAAGRSTWDWRYRYISANIRAGNPWADSEPVPTYQVFQPQPSLFALTQINFSRRF